MSDPSRSVRMYRRLLWLYPKRFRTEFGEDMVFVFEELRRDVPAGRLWLRVLRDAGSSIVIQRLESVMQNNSVLPATFALLAGVVLVAVSTLGADNLLTFAVTVLVSGGSAIAALVYWYANRPYREPSEELHRHWLRFLVPGVTLIALVNVGTGLDIEAPWEVLFASIIGGIMLIVIGVLLGLWNGFAALRRRGDNGAWPAS